MKLYKTWVTVCKSELEFDLDLPDGFQVAMKKHLEGCELCREFQAACGKADATMRASQSKQDGPTMMFVGAWPDR